MKKTFSLISPVIISLVMAMGGCSIDKTSLPVATVIGGTPTTVQVTLSSATIANGGNTTVTATVMDTSANVVPNVNVSFSVISATAGSFSPASAVTDASGVATATFTAGAAVDATATIRAAVTVGASTISGTASITIGTPPRVPTSVAVALSSTTIAATGGAATVTATVTDASGVISGVTVSFSASVAGAGSLSAATATTDASGIATVTYTANAGNTYVTITATTGSLNNSATLMIGNPPPPTPTSMSLTINPLSIGIQSQAAVSVTLRDSSGNPAFNNGVTFLITGGTGTGSFNPLPAIVSSVLATTNSSGVATATFYSGATSGSINIQAQSSTGGLLQSAGILITSDPASISLSVVDPNLVNGETTNISATVRNIMNNAVSDGTVVNFAITSLGTPAGALSNTSASTISGIAQVTFTADPSVTGGVIIQATVGTLPAVQTIIIVNAALAGSLQYVSVDPPSGVINILGAGTSDATVKFKVISSAGATLPGQNVSFTLYGPTGATLDTGGLTTSNGSTDADGEVTTILHAGLVAGTVQILAQTTVAPIFYASSGAISIGGGVPSDRFFSVAVSKFNLDGFGCNNLQSTITAYLADRFGNYNILKGTSVSFYTDSGAMDTSNVTDDTGITSSVFRTQTPLPTDVDPDTVLWSEPSYTALVSGVTHTYNPRDGWLTILVSTTGEEYFQDDNANGVHDPGETTFTDLPEPFIDSNDNNTRDSGELFFDWPSYVIPNIVPGNPVNPNGVYDDVNGRWDAKIPIFRKVNLVMTGRPSFGSNTTRVVSYPTGTTADITVPRAGPPEYFIVYVSDINMNALIKDTKISMTSDKTEASITLVSGAETLADGLSYGPAELIYRITNNNTSSPAVSVAATISVTIDWPGNCGRAAKYTIFYPGTITLP